MLNDFSVLQDTPFTDRGSVVEVFTDLSVWENIRKIIEQINYNAAV
jgi:type I restriction enzyme R subunit